MYVCVIGSLEYFYYEGPITYTMCAMHNKKKIYN